MLTNEQIYAAGMQVQRDVDMRPALAGLAMDFTMAVLYQLGLVSDEQLGEWMAVYSGPAISNQQLAAISRKDISQ